MSLSRGHLMIDGRRFPVTSVTLTGGKIRIEAYAVGPLPSLTGPVTVFGEDGVGVLQGSWLELPPVREGDVWDVVYWTTIAYVEDDGPVRIG